MKATGFLKKLTGLNRVTTREAAQLTGLSIPATSMALRRLAADGLIIPLKKGNWLLGKSLLRPGTLVTAAAAPYQAYLSGWSALRIHDCIQQIPQEHFAVTLGRPGEVDMAGTRIVLHHMTPELFDGYEYDSRIDGFVALPEKAIFDLAYLATRNRSRVSGNLPETDMRRLKWKQMKNWTVRIRSVLLQRAVERNLRRIREQHAAIND